MGSLRYQASSGNAQRTYTHSLKILIPTDVPGMIVGARGLEWGANALSGNALQHVVASLWLLKPQHHEGTDRARFPAGYLAQGLRTFAPPDDASHMPQTHLQPGLYRPSTFLTPTLNLLPGRLALLQAAPSPLTTSPVHSPSPHWAKDLGDLKTGWQVA